MGFQYQARVYNLVFDDPNLDGLEVKVGSLSIGELRRITERQDGDSDSETTDAMLGSFAKALIKWNLEDDAGFPVPTTTQGINDQPMDLIMNIIQAWLSAMTDVDDELGKGLASGRRSLEESLPMEPLSPNPTS